MNYGQAAKSMRLQGIQHRSINYYYHHLRCDSPESICVIPFFFCVFAAHYHPSPPPPTSQPDYSVPRDTTPLNATAFSQRATLLPSAQKHDDKTVTIAFSANTITHIKVQCDALPIYETPTTPCTEKRRWCWLHSTVRGAKRFLQTFFRCHFFICVRTNNMYITTTPPTRCPTSKCLFAPVCRSPSVRIYIYEVYILYVQFLEFYFVVHKKMTFLITDYNSSDRSVQDGASVARHHHAGVSKEHYSTTRHDMESS